MKRKAFTLIELLVVIAILMPSLMKVKKIARTVVCQSNLKQWGLVFGLYVQDNNDRFYRAWTSSNRGHEWVGAMKPYYQNEKMCFCPEATKVGLLSAAATPTTANPANAAWGVFPETDTRVVYRGMSGSYGIQWVEHCVVGIANQTAMDGNNGGWAVLYGSNPVSASGINLAIEEDVASDVERNHISEQVGYIVFE